VKTPEQWLQDPELFATSAMALLSDVWGTEFIEWDPTTLALQLKTDFGFEPSPALQDRIQAACSLFTSNLFFVSIETFNPICDTLNFGTTVSNLLVPADLDDVLWGISEARILLGDDFQEDEFSHDVKRYIGLLLSQAGIRKPPKMLEFAEYDAAEAERYRSELDDELLSEVFWKTQEEDKVRLTRENNVRIMLLFRQLSLLPIRTGDTQFIRELMSRTQP